MRARAGETRNPRVTLSLLLLFLWLLVGVMAHAQQDEGTITGTVTDVTGAVVADAIITVTEVNTGFTLTRTSNKSGDFTVSPLKIGTYRIKISASGFEAMEQSGLELHAQERLGIDAKLKVGSATETVEVTARQAQLQTEESSVGQTVSTDTIKDTALNGRNYVYIAQMTMGVAPGTQGSRGEAKGDFSANGQRAEQNNFILDGVDNNVNLADFLNGASFVIKPPPDALQEFGVQTSNYSAELGHAAGGVINASIKSGTNAVHGSIWEFFRNDKLNDTDWFTLTKPEYRQNQFGATLGGPLLKNKLFVFGDTEVNRIVYQETSNFYNVPTALMQSSGFTNYTELLNPALTGTSAHILYQRGSSTNIQNCGGATNILCASQVNPVALSLLKQYPLPNYGAVGQTTGNYLFEGKVTDNTTQYDVRSDWNISTADQVFARYSYSQEPSKYPSPLGPVLDGGSFAADGQVEDEGRNFTMSETHVFSPKLVNEARFGYNWIHASFAQENSGTDIAATYGLGGVPFSAQNGGLPGLTISGLTKAGSPSFFPSSEYENVAQFLDNITTSFGKHSLKFGVSLQRIRYSTLQPTSPKGAYSFTGKYTQNPNATSTTGSGIADFAMDDMASASINNIYVTENQRWYNAVYVQDDWKVTRKLTLNLGVRWEYAQPYVELHGHQANFVPVEPTTPGAAGSGSYLIPRQAQNYPLPPVLVADLALDNITVKYTDNNSLVNSAYLNFAPRIGFAFSPTSKMVVRGGYGIFYGGLENLGYGPNLGSSSPFAVTGSVPALGCTVGNCPLLTDTTNGVTTPEITLETGLIGALQSDGTVNPNYVSSPGLKTYAASNKTPYTESYNLSVQYALSRGMSATIAYVGNVDDHLRASSSTNTYDGLLTPGASYISHEPFPAFGGGGYIIDSGIGNYNSLQSKLEKNASKNLTFLATYTYSHALDDARPPLNGYAGQASYRQPQWLGIHYDYGSDLQDVRQRATINGHYTLPFGKSQRFLNRDGVLNQIAGGWETSLTFRVQTGNPAELVANNTLGNGSAYPLRVADPFALGGTLPANTPSTTACAASTKTVTHWFNPCAFQNPVSVTAANYNIGALTPASAAIFYGNQGSTNVVGPGYNRVDATLFKDFALIHETRLQLRADFFNLLNTPAHGQPATSVGGGGGAETNQTQTGTFGQITSERFHGEQPDSRVIQLSAKYQF